VIVSPVRRPCGSENEIVFAVGSTSDAPNVPSESASGAAPWTAWRVSVPPAATRAPDPMTTDTFGVVAVAVEPKLETLTTPPPMLLVAESASVVPTARRETLLEVRTTEPAWPTVVVTVPPDVAVEVEPPMSSRPPESVLRLDVATEEPSASTVRVCAPDVAEVPVPVRTWPRRRAVVVPEDAAVGLAFAVMLIAPPLTFRKFASARLLDFAVTLTLPPGARRVPVPSRAASTTAFAVALIELPTPATLTRSDRLSWPPAASALFADVKESVARL
jgi:hypothetical protein